MNGSVPSPDPTAYDAAPVAYRRLRPSARLVLDDRFLSGDSRPDLSAHEEPAELDHDLDAALLIRLLRAAITRGGSDAADRLRTDAWLAPRLHAVVRLRRNEAADNRLWFWLAATHGREYVRWRWPATTEGKSLKRYTGGDRDNALSRLWWTAELFRDGADYSNVLRAFELQDMTNTWLSLDAMHHPAAAQAAVEKIASWGGGNGGRLSKRANRLAHVLNHHLTTVMLDAVAPSPGPDAGAAEEWVHQQPDEYEILDEVLPPGPDEDPADPEHVGAISALLDRVAAQEGVDLLQ